VDLPDGIFIFVPGVELCYCWGMGRGGGREREAKVVIVETDE